MRKNNKHKISNQELVFFFSRLEMYISSGLSIDKAIALIASTSKRNFKRSYEFLHEKIIKGQRLSFAIIDTFNISPSIASIIENGESSGKLSESLIFSKEILEKENQLKKKCLGALSYPLLIGIFSFGMTLFLIQGVMKQISPLLTSLKISLPFSTKILIYLSSNISKYGLYLIIILPAFLGLLHYIYRKKPLFRYQVHRAIIRLPLIGGSIILYQLFLISKAMGSMLGAGLPLDKAYQKVFFTNTLLPLKFHFQKFSNKLEEGYPVSKIFSTFGLPVFISSLVQAGEMTGNLSKAFLYCSEIIEKDLDNTIRKFTVLIEPAMMIAVGSVVGFVAISIMLPIYSISNSLQHS